MFFSRTFVGEIQLVISVVLFGFSFVFQRFAMLNGIGPLTYNACRYTASILFLIITKVFLQNFIHTQVETDINTGIIVPKPADVKVASDLWLWGIICGMANFGASTLQQISLVTLSAGKVGFITGTYVVTVPFFELFIPGLGSQLTIRSWIAATVCLTGLYLLSGCLEAELCLGGAIGNAEVICYISVLFWSASIMGSDIGAKKLDVIDLLLVDFSVCTLCCITAAFLYESETWAYPFDAIRSNWFPIIAVGFSESGAFLLSTLGQMYTAPARSALLLSLESVTSCFFGFLFLNEHLTMVECCGCFLMFLSTLITSFTLSSTDNDDKNEYTSIENKSDITENTIFFKKKLVDEEAILNTYSSFQKE
jgi:drug/metabolite transporter (DMT)-like permease